MGTGWSPWLLGLGVGGAVLYLLTRGRLSSTLSVFDTKPAARKVRTSPLSSHHVFGSCISLFQWTHDGKPGWRLFKLLRHAAEPQPRDTLLPPPPAAHGLEQQSRRPETHPRGPSPCRAHPPTSLRPLPPLRRSRSRLWSAALVHADTATLGTRVAAAGPKLQGNPMLSGALLCGGWLHEVGEGGDHLGRLANSSPSFLGTSCR